MILKTSSKKANKYAIMNYHYSKRLPNIACSYSVFNKKNEWCGIIAYGLGASPSIGKPYNLGQGEILELVRVALNGKQESTSKAVAISMRLIKKDCPSTKLLVSFADKGQNHKGIIYQATNWYYVGQTNTTGKEYFYKGRWTHSKTISDLVKNKGLKRSSLKSRNNSGKIKYIYPLNKLMRKKCIKISKPYLKNISIDSLKVKQHNTNVKKVVQYQPQCSI